MNRADLDLLDSWRHNIPKFAWDNFRVDVEDWSRDVCDKAVAKPKARVAMQAAVGVGKSFTEAVIGWHFLATNADLARHPGKFPNGIALSISADNLKSGLWKELGVWYNVSPFLQSQFEYSGEQIVHRQYPQNWWLRARSFAKTATPETQGATLSGLHSPWTLVLLDEIGEMHPAIGRRAEQVLSDAECERGLIVAAGNPTSLTGLLYDIATSGKHWEVIRVSGDPDDPTRSKRVDIQWAREQIERYGRENPWVMAHILGMFPPGGINAILTADEVRAAMHRNPTPDQYHWAQARLGVDVARFGDDRTVIFPRQGNASWMPKVLRNADTNQVAAVVAQMAGERRSELEIIDDTGHWGHGVYDQLKAAGRQPIAVQFHAPALDSRYKNRRVEGWMRMADAIKAGLALPNIPELIPELTLITYTFDNGKFALEDKDMLKKRLGWSPDIADALALTFMHPEMPRNAAQMVPFAPSFADAAYKPHQRRR